MSGANIIPGPWLPRLRCDGCARHYQEGHILGPIYFHNDRTPYRLCFGCFNGDRVALLSAAQKARKHTGKQA